MKKLYRKSDSEIAGICSGIGEYFGIDPTIVRLIFVILFFTPIPIVWSYIFFWMIIPKEPTIF